MKVIHVTHNDGMGGASMAAYRQHVGYLAKGIDSYFFVKESSGRVDNTIESASTNCSLTFKQKLLRRYLSQRYKEFENTNHGANPHLLYGIRTIHRSIHNELEEFDIINFHWVSDFIDFPSFFKGIKHRQRVVWTMHDTAAITGSCHHFLDCDEYKIKCNSCFQIQQKEKCNVSYKSWKEKKDLYDSIEEGKLTLVSPSIWLKERAEESSLTKGFKIVHIPNGIDTDIYRPHNTDTLRNIFQIPQKSLVILIIQKGENLLYEALHEMKERQDVVVLTMGQSSVRFQKLVKTINLGFISNEQLKSMMYSLADIFILPSQIDNYPNTLLESFACGTPAIASNVGGIPEIVEDGKSGFLFNINKTTELTNKLKLVINLNKRNKLEEMGKSARNWAVNNVSLKIQTDRYLKLYKDILR